MKVLSYYTYLAKKPTNLDSIECWRGLEHSEPSE